MSLYLPNTVLLNVLGMFSSLPQHMLSFVVVFVVTVVPVVIFYSYIVCRVPCMKVLFLLLQSKLCLLFCCWPLWYLQLGFKIYIYPCIFMRNCCFHCSSQIVFSGQFLSLFWANCGRMYSTCLMLKKFVVSMILIITCFCCFQQLFLFTVLLTYSMTI